MTKVLTRLSVMIIAMLAGVASYGQVEIDGTSYSRLSLAFNAINAGTHEGDIEVKITNNFTENTTAILYPSGYGNADYSSVVIYPTGTYKIDGNLTNGIIQLQGTKYVTIDGRVNMSGSTRALTIKNNATSGPIIRIDTMISTSYASKYNVVKYCNIEHSSKSSTYGVTFGASNSWSNYGINNYNEVAYNSFKFLYQAVRVYGTSSYKPIGNKIYGNIFGSSNLSQSISYQVLYIYYADNTEVYDNIFEYLDYTSTIYAIYMYYSPNSKVNNNIFRNVNHVSGLYGLYCYYSPSTEVSGNTFENFRTGSSQCYPIYIYHSSQAAYNVSDNYMNNVGGASTFYGIYLANGSYSTVNNNTLKNIVNSGSTTYGIMLSSCSYAQMNYNTIENVQALATTTNYMYYLSSCSYAEFIGNTLKNVRADYVTYGVYGASCSYAKFNGNLIDNIECYGASATGAVGFYFSSCTGSEIINNSVSRMISTQYSSSSTTQNPFGILITGGNAYKIYYNSVNLTGKQITVGSQGTLSACLMMTSTSVNSYDLRNNNFYNDLEGASGSRSYAIYIPSSSNLSSSTMDYNNYYVGGTYGRFGYMGGDRYDLAQWKSATSREANSNNLFTNFNSASVLAPYIGSPLLGKGTPISGVQYDIIGVTRSGSNPTPGAYEEADDIVGPEIIHTTLVTTTSTSNRTVVATITDKTGVNLTNSAPRLYYRNTSTTNTFNDNSSSTAGWKYSEYTQNGDEFTFVIDYSKLQDGGSVGSDIEYFIIARDVAGKLNMSITSGNFASFPTTTNLTADNFPVNNATKYRIALGFSGNYNVGTNQSYTTLTKDNGIFRAITENVVAGDITITIVSNISGETGEYQLKKLTYEGGPYNITIRPNSTTQRSISGDVAGALIGIVGANNVTIDGSYNGAGRYLKFLNSATSSTTTYRAAIMVGSGGGVGGRDITIKNCEITNGERLNYSFGIITSDGAITTSTSSNSMNNLLIKNNYIYNSTYGIYVAGGTGIGTTTQNNLVIEDNIVGHDTKSTSILSYGIEVRYAPNGQVRRNKIYNFDGGPNNTNYCIGIQLYMTGSTPTYIDGNTISGLSYQGTSVCFVHGVNLASGSYAVIQNNKISEILTTAYLSYYPTNYMAAGIKVSGSYCKIWHNTIIMQGEMKYYTTSSGYGGCAFNILIPSTYSYNDIRGNILHNSVYRASSSIYDPEAALIFVYTSSYQTYFFQELNHNVYSVGNTAKYFSYHNTTTLPYTYYSYSLGQFQSVTGRDQNSKVGMPIFKDNKADLHINGSSIGDSYYMFTRMAEVANDGDGEMRNATTYYGADEVNAIFELAEDTKITPSQATYCVDYPVTVSAKPEVTGFGDGVARTGLQKVDINWYKNGVLIPGQKTNSLTFNPVMMSDSAKYYATGTFMGKTISSTETLLKVETPIVITVQPPNSDVCVTNPYLTMTLEATGTFSGYQWEFKQKGGKTWNDLPGKTSNVLELTITPDLIGDYRARVIGPGNCGPAIVYTDAASVMFSDPLHSVNLTQIEESADKDLHYVCVDENITLNVTDEGTVFGYRWQINTGAGFIDLSASQYPSAHTPTLRINGSNPSESGIYRVKVLGSASCGTAEVFSQEVDVRIWPYFSLDEQPQSRTLCEGENSFIRVNISGIVYSYQWFKDGKMLTAAESEFYNRPVFYFTDAQFEDAGVYRCRVQAEDCFGYVDFMSDEASLYIVTGTSITVPPMTQSVVPGGSINFRVRAHVNGTPDNYKPEVQWYKGNTALVDGGRFIGTKSDKLNIVNVQESDFGEDYRVVVTGHCGSAAASVFGILKGEITITEQPKDAELCEDESIVLSVRAESSNMGNLTYHWYKDGIELVEGNGLLGVKSNDLTISPAKPNHSGNYYCLIKEGKSVTGILTIEASVTISPKPVIITQPDESVTVVSGAVLALMVEVEGTDLVYQWYFEGVAIPDEDTNTLMIYNAKEENAGKYYVVITNNCGATQSIVTDVIVTTSTSDIKDVTSHGFSLGNATPNPVNGSSDLQFVTPSQSPVRISLVNNLGAEIAVLSDGVVAQGQHIITLNAEKLNLTSGVYSVVLKSTGVVLTQRVVVVR